MNSPNPSAQYRVTVNGTSYDVSIELLAPPAATPPGPASPPSKTPPASPPQRPVPAPAGPAPQGKPGDIVSPLAGKVVSVDVTVGEELESGDQVAVIEAMKMNTNIYASAPGRVALILVAPGDAVEEGQPLVRIS